MLPKEQRIPLLQNPDNSLKHYTTTDTQIKDYNTQCKLYEKKISLQQPLSHHSMDKKAKQLLQQTSYRDTISKRNIKN